MLLDKIANFIIRNSFVRFVSFLVLFFISFCCYFILSNMFSKPLFFNDLKSFLIVVSGLILLMLWLTLVPIFYFILMKQYFKQVKLLLQNVLIIDISENVELFFILLLFFVNFAFAALLSNSVTLPSSGSIISNLELFLITTAIIAIVAIIATIKTGLLKLLAKNGYFKLHNLQVQTFVPLTLISQINAHVKTLYYRNKSGETFVKNVVVAKIFFKNNSSIIITDYGLDEKLSKTKNKKKAKEINELLTNQQLETMS